MKRPNGYGSVINLGKNRRQPWAVRVTDLAASAADVVDGQRKRKYRYIGYFETKQEAYDALDRFNSAKTPLDCLGMTFYDIWQKWAERNLETGSSARMYSYKAAIEKCKPLYDRRITDLRLADLQEIVDNYEGKSKSCLNNIKIVMGFIYDYAIKNDIVNKDYSKYIEINAKKEENHAPLTHKAVDRLLAVPDPTEAQKMMMIYIFTGCRLNELMSLKKENIYLEEQYFRITKAKTAAGVRIVPIADKILPIFKEFCNKPGKNLFAMKSDTYRALFTEFFAGQTPHATRSTFISFLTEKDVPQIIIQKIVGHASGNVTGDVYTRLSLQPLLEAVNRL